MSANFMLSNKRVVATGKLKNYTRKELLTILRRHGALPTHKVSSRTDYLIVGSKPGGKLKKALDLDVCLISEVDLEIVLSECRLVGTNEYEQLRIDLV